MTYQTTGGADRSAGQPRGVKMPRLLVSVHMPKTAGTSFAAALQVVYGPGYRPDYADLPMQMPRWRRRSYALWKSLRPMVDDAASARVGGIRCIHGHFLPAKYARLIPQRQVGFVTWLRDPVERVLSHYHYWRRDYDGSDSRQPLRNRMLAERWSLERFVLGPELRNVYSQYLWNFDPARFDFIGITERYGDDLASFSERFLDGSIVMETALVNPGRAGERYEVTAGLRSRIEAHHAADVALYRHVLQRGTAAGGVGH